MAAVSSLVFAFMHSINLFSGAAPLVVAITVFYAFGFGVLMYLSMRVSGFLIVAIVLHSLTDPTTILATGGLDETASDAAQNALLTAASPFNFVIMFAGLILLIFVRGRVPARQQRWRRRAVHTRAGEAPPRRPGIAATTSGEIVGHLPRRR